MIFVYNENDDNNNKGLEFDFLGQKAEREHIAI